MSLPPSLREKLRVAAVDAAQEYCDARWPEQNAHPLFVIHLAETHFQDALTRAYDEACDALDESGENPSDWMEEAEREENWSLWGAA